MSCSRSHPLLFAEGFSTTKKVMGELGRKRKAGGWRRRFRHRCQARGKRLQISGELRETKRGGE